MKLNFVSLAEVADTTSGGTPQRGVTQFYGGGIPWIKSGELPDGPITTTEESITELGVAASSAKILPAGTLLIAMYGATVGRLGITAMKAATNQAVCAIFPGPKVDRDFLFYWLLNIRERLVKASFGGAQPNISQAVIRETEIPLLEIGEQRRIAKNLNAQLAAVEEARQAAQARLDNAGLLAERIRNQAFKGLLADWPREQALSDVCTISAGGTPSRGTSAYFQGEIPWVKTLDLNFGTVEDTEEKITPDAFRSIRGKSLRPGTVLVAMYGGAGTIGKSGVLGLAACTNQAVCALQPRREELDSQFLHEWICHVRPEWMKLAGGNRKDPNINKSIVEAMTLPLPPLKEQVTFRSRLCTQLVEAHAIVDAASRQLAEIERLPQRLLAEVFAIEKDVQDA